MPDPIAAGPASTADATGTAAVTASADSFGTAVGLSSSGTSGTIPRTGHLFVLVGPGGSGKTAIISAVLAARPLVHFIPTTTTRTPRPGEQDGYHYCFVSDSEFAAMQARGELLESERIHGNWYGTSRLRIAELLAAGQVGITSLDYRGGTAVRAAFPQQTTTVFVQPGSLDELRARLEARPGSTEADVRARLARAAEEMAHADQCDHLVVNADGALDVAVCAVLSVMDECRRR